VNILIIGGTRFLGRHLVTAALARRHEITLFHRGKHSSDVSTVVETIHGDRYRDLGKLEDRKWDAVIDTCGMLPRAVRAAAESLAGSVDRYIFISTQNVYPDVSVPGVDESSPLATLTDEQLGAANAIDTAGEPSYGQMYGGLKALCERAADEVMPQSVLVIRPGLIVGPYDYTDRFTYWVDRIARGGEVLAPGRTDRFIQFIDVRDLAEWTVSMIERKESGVYNANGTPAILTMGSFLDECRSVGQSKVSITWASEKFLLKEEVAAWSEMPLWLPEEAAPHLKGFMFVNSDKAVRAGLRFRPLKDTIAATLAWYQTDRSSPSERLKAGLDPAKEEALLRKLHGG
jgi:nucleoside-diphosphate-sugar epimerase